MTVDEFKLTSSFVLFSYPPSSMPVSAEGCAAPTPTAEAEGCAAPTPTAEAEGCAAPTAEAEGCVVASWS